MFPSFPVNEGEDMCILNNLHHTNHTEIQAQHSGCL